MATNLLSAATCENTTSNDTAFESFMMVMVDIFGYIAMVENIGAFAIGIEVRKNPCLLACIPKSRYVMLEKTVMHPMNNYSPILIIQMNEKLPIFAKNSPIQIHSGLQP